jgi:hypothetical protein
MLLNPGFATSAGHLGPGLGVVGALAPIELIYDQRLVHQGVVHGHVEDGVVQFNRLDGVTVLISYWDFHVLE